MPIDTLLLTKRLGLPDDATEEQINEALEAEETPETEPPEQEPEGQARGRDSRGGAGGRRGARGRTPDRRRERRGRRQDCVGEHAGLRRGAAEEGARGRRPRCGQGSQDPARSQGPLLLPHGEGPGGHEQVPRVPPEGRRPRSGTRLVRGPGGVGVNQGSGHRPDPRTRPSGGVDHGIRRQRLHPVLRAG
jgi:hypothetical protein